MYYYIDTYNTLYTTLFNLCFFLSFFLCFFVSLFLCFFLCFFLCLLLIKYNVTLPLYHRLSTEIVFISVYIYKITGGLILIPVLTSTPELLLEEWRNGNYTEVATAVATLAPAQIVSFCELLSTYEGRYSQ